MGPRPPIPTTRTTSRAPSACRSVMGRKSTCLPIRKNLCETGCVCCATSLPTSWSRRLRGPSLRPMLSRHLFTALSAVQPAALTLLLRVHRRPHQRQAQHLLPRQRLLQHPLPPTRHRYQRHHMGCQASLRLYVPRPTPTCIHAASRACQRIIRHQARPACMTESRPHSPRIHLAHVLLFPRANLRRRTLLLLRRAQLLYLHHLWRQNPRPSQPHHRRRRLRYPLYTRTRARGSDSGTSQVAGLVEVRVRHELDITTCRGMPPPPACLSFHNRIIPSLHAIILRYTTITPPPCRLNPVSLRPFFLPRPLPFILALLSHVAFHMSYRPSFMSQVYIYLHVPHLAYAHTCARRCQPCPVGSFVCSFVRPVHPSSIPIASPITSNASSSARLSTRALHRLPRQDRLRERERVLGPWPLAQLDAVNAIVAD